MPDNIGNNINKSPAFGYRLWQLVLKGGDCSHTAEIHACSALEAKVCFLVQHGINLEFKTSV